MVSHLFFYQLALIALVWLFFLLFYAWPSDRAGCLVNSIFMGRGAPGQHESSVANFHRSYWIPGSYALALSEKGDSFLRLLKHKGFREENMTKVGLYAIGTYTTLESNKSLEPISETRKFNSF